MHKDWRSLKISRSSIFMAISAAIVLLVAILVHSASALVVLILASTVYVIRSWKWDSIGSYIAIFFALEFGVRPLIDLTIPAFFNSDAAFSSGYYEVLLFEALAVLIFYVAYDMARDENTKPPTIQRKTPTITSGKLIVLLIIIVLAKLGLVLTGHATSTGVVGGGFVSNLLARISSANVAVTALALSNIRSRFQSKTAARVLIASIIVEVLWSVLIGSKLGIFRDALIIMLFGAVLGFKVRRILFISFAGLLLAAGGISLERHVKPPVNVVYSETVLGNNVLTVGIDDLLARFDNFPTALRILTAKDTFQNHMIGQQMIHGVVTQVLIPVPFPGKTHINVGAEIAQYIWNIPTANNIHIGAGMAASMYMSFGYIGSLASMGLLGLIMGRYNRVIKHFVYDRPSVTALIFFAISSVYLVDVEQAWFDVLDAVVKSTFVWLMFVAITSTRDRRDLKNNESTGSWEAIP